MIRICEFLQGALDDPKKVSIRKADDVDSIFRKKLQYISTERES